MPATRPTEVTPTAVGFRIRFCTWCKQIDVRGPRRETDVVTILIIGKIILAAWNGKVMIVQDGICERCAEVLVKGGSTTDLAERLKDWITHARSENSVHVSIPVDVAELLLSKVTP